jgi:hypothetical protein
MGLIRATKNCQSVLESLAQKKFKIFLFNTILETKYYLHIVYKH